MASDPKAPARKKLLAKASKKVVNAKTGRPVWYDRSRDGFDWRTPIVGAPARRLISDMKRHYGCKPAYGGCSGSFNVPFLNRLESEVHPKETAAEQLLEACAVWYAKRAQTHYSYPQHSAERMDCPPLPGVAPWTDCSGMVRCLWWQLDQKHPGEWPDPAGAAYAVWGNSDSIIDHCRNFGESVALGSERTGDIACYVGGVGHAELVTARGTVLTNGNEAGPYYRPIGRHSGRLYICRLRPFL